MLNEQYQNDFDTFKGEVETIEKAIESIKSIVARSMYDDSHPLYMFISQLAEELVQLIEKTNTIRILVDVVLPPVMEKCNSDDWVQTSLSERQDWMMNRASAH